jgi:hypothetical protein
MSDPKITPELRQLVREYRRDGMPYRTIARKVGLSPSGAMLAAQDIRPKRSAFDAILGADRKAALARLAERLFRAEPEEVERRDPVKWLVFEEVERHTCPTCERVTTFAPCVACTARLAPPSCMDELPGDDPVVWLDVFQVVEEDQPAMMEQEAEEIDVEAFDWLEPVGV